MSALHGSHISGTYQMSDRKWGKVMNLDERIEQKRNEAVSRQSLDVYWFDDSINIHTIYSDIEKEADSLQPVGKGEYKVYALPEKSSMALFNKCRVIDEKMKRFRFYRLYLRDFLKKIYKKMNGQKQVKMKQILRFEGEDFIHACYEQILLREPDKAGLWDNLRRLQLRQVSRIEMAYDFSFSHEAVGKGIVVKGCKVRYYMLRCLRKLFRIPVVGRIFRFTYHFFCINRTMNSMICWNMKLQEKIQGLENLTDRVKALENLSGRVQALEELAEGRVEKLVTQSRKLEQLESLTNQRVEQLENLSLRIEHMGDMPGRVENLEENIRNNNVLIKKHESALTDDFEQQKKSLENFSVAFSNLKSEIKQMQPAVGSEKKEDNVEKHEGVTTVVSESDQYLSIDYFDFENRFRGSREHVKQVQEIYLPYFKKCKNVLDLGCGRGEFVELLQENGIGVKGVDLYSPYVEYCKLQNLPVEQGDALAYLRGQERVDGIFLGQVVEHLSTAQTIELCRIAYDKLEVGGYLIMETPNPTSLAIYTESFYMDPSHNRPIHPKTLQYITEKQGFSQVQILFTESSRLPYDIPKLAEHGEGRTHEFDLAMERVADLLFGSQDYAIIAKK